MRIFVVLASFLTVLFGSLAWSQEAGGVAGSAADVASESVAEEDVSDEVVGNAEGTDTEMSREIPSELNRFSVIIRGVGNFQDFNRIVEEMKTFLPKPTSALETLIRRGRILLSVKTPASLNELASALRQATQRYERLSVSAEGEEGKLIVR